MDSIETLIFILSAVFSFWQLAKWYASLSAAWPPQRVRHVKYILSCLPAASLIVILYTLIFLASFDVVDSIVYIMFYIFLGYAWIFSGIILMSRFFDLSWIDDALYLNNKAALIPVAGGFLGLTAIYSGANIGNGPGWWCVIFAGGLGLISWFVLGLAVNKFTYVFERITVGRELGCGVRFGLYLLAGGILLARASAGDWTSFYMTVIEFKDGWPVLPLTVLMIAVERYYIRKSETDYDTDDNYLLGSVLWGIIYIIIAAASIMLLPPLSSNPVYYAGIPEIFI